jgi:hypothetical protein
MHGSVRVFPLARVRPGDPGPSLVGSAAACAPGSVLGWPSFFTLSCMTGYSADRLLATDVLALRSAGAKAEGGQWCSSSLGAALCQLPRWLSPLPERRLPVVGWPGLLCPRVNPVGLKWWR